MTWPWRDRLVALAAAAAVGALASPGTPGAEEGDPEKGRKLAEKQCGRCHVVGEANRLGGIDSTPSFFLFARKQDKYLDRVRTFYQRLPHPSFIRVEGIPKRTELPSPAAPFEIALDDIDHIVAYIKTLETERGTRTRKASP